MPKCCDCGAACGTEHQPQLNSTMNPKYWCDACAKKHAEESMKAWGSAFSFLGALFRGLGRLAKAVGKALKNKWFWTICSLGFTWIAWKLLDKIYAPKD